MAEDKNPTTSDLQYDWPTNVLEYETRFILGLSVTELIIIAMLGFGLGTVNAILGIVSALAGFLIVKRYEGLGDRNLVNYGLARLQYAMLSGKEVRLPLIYPVGDSEEMQYTIEDIDGNVVYEVGEEQ